MEFGRKKTVYRLPSTESGNVFLFILLGVILFGALAFVIARGMRSDTTTAMTERQAELIAVDVLSYAQRMERAVGKIQQRGASENDISFENNGVAGYDHTPAQPATHEVFDPSGGGVTWKLPPPKANDASPWHFTGRTCIADIGTGATGCDGDNISNEELLAVLPNVNQSVCHALDKKLGIASIPANTGGVYSTVKYQGVFADSTEIKIGSSRNAACYSDGGNYHFYYVLIAR